MALRDIRDTIREKMIRKNVEMAADIKQRYKRETLISITCLHITLPFTNKTYLLIFQIHARNKNR